MACFSHFRHPGQTARQCCADPGTSQLPRRCNPIHSCRKHNDRMPDQRRHIRSGLSGMTCFLLFALTPLPAQARDAYGCPRFEQPEIIIRPILDPPRYDISKNLSTLLAMGQAEDRSKFSNTESETPVGLTAASLTFNTEYQIITTIAPNDNMICSQIKSFTLDFGFNDTTIYLASELPRNSCSFRQVLDHELKHVRMDQRLVKIYTQKFPAIFTKAIRQVGTLRTASSDEAKRKIKRTISNYISGLSKSLSGVREKYQRNVDTKGEYERLRRSCNGKLEQLIRKHRR